MLFFLIQTKTLWVLFLATIALAIGFQLATPLAGGALLDTSTTLGASEDLLQLMSAQQKRAHLWITVLLDVPFPFAYGGLFLGLCLRYGGRYSLYLAAPAFLVIPIDLIENTVQFIALLGNESLLPAKAYLTPAKFLLFYVAALIAMGSLSISLGSGVFRKFSN